MAECYILIGTYAQCHVLGLDEGDKYCKSFFLGYNSSYFITIFINNFRISGSFDTEEPECEATS